ncbi:MAG: recombinase family protein, partial [Chloroflexaceae bacterium]|nr:recombinase family protein [Chloroflexaceae bacterium]
MMIVVGSWGDLLAATIQGTYPVTCKTPLGFIADEVELFWPLLFERLQLKAQFPLRLRPETEQALALRLWQPILAQSEPTLGNPSRVVRRILDLLQLAGAAALETEQIPLLLAEGWPATSWQALSRHWLTLEGHDAQDNSVWEAIAQCLGQWRQWCLSRGLLTYGLIYELYWRYLLPDARYQQQLWRRYRAVFADDTDDYPAIAKELLEVLLAGGAFGVFAYNSDGQVRLGLNADPNYLLSLAKDAPRETCDRSAGLPAASETAIQLMSDPSFFATLPRQVQSLQTISRAELLRAVAQTIIAAVQGGEVQPGEVAIVAPGLDEIARYALMQMLSAQEIPVFPLNEQRPLISSPLVRALLVLLALVYPDLGRTLDRDGVAEMLVVLSDRGQDLAHSSESLSAAIDPVRAGLIADHCFLIDLAFPRLLPVTAFSRWDRLGHRATSAYSRICTWIEQTRAVYEAAPFNAIFCLNDAINTFLTPNSLPYDQLAALKELMETAQHYWEVERRLQDNESSWRSPTEQLEQFIELLQQGTVTANPRPARNFSHKDGVMLATIFQYRSLRACHP